MSKCCFESKKAEGGFKGLGDTKKVALLWLSGLKDNPSEVALQKENHFSHMDSRVAVFSSFDSQKGQDCVIRIFFSRRLGPK